MKEVYYKKRKTENGHERKKFHTMIVANAFVFILRVMKYEIIEIWRT